MSLRYINQHLQLENIPIAQIVQQYGTPCYIYSKTELIKQWQAFSESLMPYPHQICYAVKANSNLSILSLLAKQGAGFDIVSGGELARVLKAGGDAKKSVFSGVGKSIDEITQALEADIGCFNVESHEELLRIETQAKVLNRIAPIALRINPDINANTHPYITTGTKDNKFGISEHNALALYSLAAQSKHLKIQGIACHLGSQLNTLQPFLQAITRLLILVEQLKEQHINLQTINIGGGLGISYNQETVPTPQDYCKAMLETLTQSKCHLRLVIEPGRALVAKAGILVTRVEYLKRHADKHFAIVDAGMNDLLRPALYQAQQTIKEVDLHPELNETIYDVVGPICESSDFLGKDKLLRIKPGDYLAILDSGAYGFSMSSNYNSRPRSAEVLVDNTKISLIRARETIEQLWANEHVYPSLRVP
ncbi:diaminopimelate decarboxylase [Candidatus Rickettsiella viridis]|uniref:Diaminopimelate decarboxylase n=1 Tax=Candidatus Rickettsiella viridis TaxID=676208 RepID=A0A2Z5V3Q4_9COXI|nr:diaminopimelate decarboxylase [Candidatus Rickettsiella viridis]BBB15082.1 diaminopimelate decarboxylase [Candidatus Rickettsiella viridis]